MNAALLGKMALGRASGDDFLELMESMGVEMQNDDLPRDVVELVKVVEPIIRRGLDSGGTFRRVQIKGKDGGTMTAFVLFDKG